MSSLCFLPVVQDSKSDRLMGILSFEPKYRTVCRMCMCLCDMRQNKTSSCPWNPWNVITGKMPSSSVTVTNSPSLSREELLAIWKEEKRKQKEAEKRISTENKKNRRWSPPPDKNSQHKRNRSSCLSNGSTLTSKERLRNIELRNKAVSSRRTDYIISSRSEGSMASPRERCRAVNVVNSTVLSTSARKEKPEKIAARPRKTLSSISLNGNTSILHTSKGKQKSGRPATRAKQVSSSVCRSANTSTEDREQRPDPIVDSLSTPTNKENKQTYLSYLAKSRTPSPTNKGPFSVTQVPVLAQSVSQKKSKEGDFENCTHFESAESTVLSPTAPNSSCNPPQKIRPSKEALNGSPMSTGRVVPDEFQIENKTNHYLDSNMNDSVAQNQHTLQSVAGKNEIIQRDKIIEHDPSIKESAFNDFGVDERRSLESNSIHLDDASSNCLDWGDDLQEDQVTRKKRRNKRRDTTLLLVPLKENVQLKESCSPEREPSSSQTSMSFDLANSKNVEDEALSVCETGDSKFEQKADLAMQEKSTLEMSSCEGSQDHGFVPGVVSKVHGNTILVDIPEANARPSNYNDEYCKCSTTLDLLRSQLEQSLVDKYTLQNKINRLRSSYEARITPFRDVFDEMKCLKVENESLKKEKQDMKVNVDKMVADLQQQMVTGMSAAVSKIQILEEEIRKLKDHNEELESRLQNNHM